MVPWWVTGITDSEGNFSINYNVNTNKLTPSFKVTQKKDCFGVLQLLHNFFGCGNIVIDNRETDGHKFIVYKRSDLLNIIIPHFENYPLVKLKKKKTLRFYGLQTLCIINGW